MRLPRDVSGAEFAKFLGQLGYVETRQTVSLLRLTSVESGERHVIVPLKRAVPLGTLRAISTGPRPASGRDC